MIKTCHQVMTILVSYLSKPVSLFSRTVLIPAIPFAQYFMLFCYAYSGDRVANMC